jgi:hypothetical protein
MQVAVSLTFSIIIVSTVMKHNTGPSLIHRHACVRAQTITHKTKSAHHSQSEATKTAQIWNTILLHFSQFFKISWLSSFNWLERMIYVPMHREISTAVAGYHYGVHKQKWRSVPHPKQQFLMNIMISHSSLTWICRLSQHQTQKCLIAQRRGRSNQDHFFLYHVFFHSIMHSKSFTQPANPQPGTPISIPVINKNMCVY